jgi:hypothetical protein
MNFLIKFAAKLKIYYQAQSINKLHFNNKASVLDYPINYQGIAKCSKLG